MAGIHDRLKVDLPPRTSPPSKLDSEPFKVHSTWFGNDTPND